MYNNLKAELVRKNMSQEELARIIDIDNKTLSFKMLGKSKFNVDEMWLIKNQVFPDLTLDYLFKQFKNNPKT